MGQTLEGGRTRTDRLWSGTLLLGGSGESSTVLHLSFVPRACWRGPISGWAGRGSTRLDRASNHGGHLDMLWKALREYERCL